MPIDPTAFEKECTFRTARSGGKGGQHVNKVETKVVLTFSPAASALFDDEEKERLAQRLASRLSQEGLLQVRCDRERSQTVNKALAIRRAIALLEKALTPLPPRRKTKPPQEAVEKRRQDKQRQSQKKARRANATPPDDPFDRH